MVIIKEVGDSLDIKIQRIDIIDKISDILAVMLREMMCLNGHLIFLMMTH